MGGTVKKRKQPARGLKTNKVIADVQHAPVSQKSRRKRAPALPMVTVTTTAALALYLTDNEKFCKCFKNNLTIIMRLCVSIFADAICREEILTPYNVESIFRRFKFRPELFISVISSVPLCENVLIFYPFGFEQHPGIRIIFSNRNCASNDPLANKFLYMLEDMVFRSIFRKWTPLNNCHRHYDFFIFQQELFVDLKENIKHYFVWFMEMITNAPNEQIVFLDEFNMNAFFKSIVEVPYGNVPIVVPVKKENDEKQGV